MAEISANDWDLKDIEEGEEGLRGRTQSYE